MENKNKKTTISKSKLYFVYFLIFSVIIVLIFIYQLVTNFYNYWKYLRDAENFYKNLAHTQTTVYPEIDKFDPIIGKSNAPIIIYEYADFFCSACKNAHQDLNEIKKAYGDRVAIVFKGLPLTVHPESRFAMLAAYCAYEQNEFSAYQDLLYENPNLLNEQKYTEYAAQLKLNPELFRTCIETQKYLPVLNKNLGDSLTMDITSLPTVYINDEKIEGFINLNTLQKIINQNL